MRITPANIPASERFPFQVTAGTPLRIGGFTTIKK
nr:MAG TPA: 4-hydroxy-3-methylbut-2-en-1-yl diphosphate synthase [Caudoviricetes sp.]DAL11641.1 MAG TPA_asm: 4-hydroxy-3-methylbut-2-en-1-yl diphosphate synthase [Caudoviricetes sp.]DAO72618.1 MAG TPA: 4-hydroxy-3-methylbut-2-en-1-yl diphosphate synthase [Caudoviricetes sp.]